MKLENSVQTRPLNQSPETFILRRIGNGNMNAVQECVEKYGGTILQLTKRYVGSEAAAEAMTLEVFDELWKCAASFNPENCREKVFIQRVVYRCLLKHEMKNRENP